MEGLDNISYLYRNQVDKLLDDQSILNQSEQLNQDEFDQIWEEMSAEIDIDEVWGDISTDLNVVMPENSGSGFIYMSLAVLLVVLSALIPDIKEVPRKPDIHLTNLSVESGKNEQPSLQITNIKQEPINEAGNAVRDESPVVRKDFEKIKNENKPAMANGKRADPEQTKMIPISNEIVSKVLAVPVITDDNMIVSRSNYTADISYIPLPLFPGDPKKIKVISHIDSDSLKLHSPASGSSLRSTDRGRISGGFITSFRNTWLLNNETFDGLRSESLNSTRIVFYPDVGLCLNYSLNKTWLLQADGFFFSNTGQKYHEYINGHYSSKRITLRYSVLAFSVKHKFSAVYFPLGASINFHAGAYISVLQNADQKLNADLENIIAQYKKFDFGIRVGGEIEFPVTGNLTMAPGLSLSLGIPNIYKGSGNIPGYLRATHNGNEEFHLALYYHFR